MSPENRRANIAEELAQSVEALAACELLSSEGLLRDAANRLYYAVFHVVRAVLLSEGLEAKSHKGLQSMLGLHFVKTGKLAAEMNEIFVRIQGYREAADYTRGFAPTEAEFARNLEGGKKLIAAGRDLLASGGWIGST